MPSIDLEFRLHGSRCALLYLGILQVGLSLCTNLAGNCAANDTWRTSAPFTSNMAIYSRSATTTYSRSTNVLLEAQNFSSPQLRNISNVDLFTTMEAFFGASPINSSQPIEQTVYDFILWTENYFNTYIMAGAPSSVTNLFRTLLTLPLLWFQPNGLSANATTVLASTLVTGLPANMTVIGNLAKGKTHISLAPWAAYVYIAVACAFLCVLTGILFVTMAIPTPNRSHFPLLDFSARVLAGGIDDTSLSQRLLHLSAIKSNKEVKDRLKSTRVFLRGLEGKGSELELDDNEVIGFTTDDTKGVRLRKGGRYVAGRMHTMDVA